MEHRDRCDIPTQAQVALVGRDDRAAFARPADDLPQVIDAEHDDLLGLFSQREWTTTQMSWFWQHQRGSLEGVHVEQTEDFDKILKEMAAYAVKHTSPEERILWLSDAALRAAQAARYAADPFARFDDQKAAGL